MNMKFKIQGAEFQSVEQGITAKLGEISYEIQDLNMMEYLQVMKAIPSILKESVEVIQDLKNVLDDDSVHPSCHQCDLMHEDIEDDFAYPTHPSDDDDDIDFDDDMEIFTEGADDDGDYGDVATIIEKEPVETK